MEVQCILCDVEDTIDMNSIIARKIQNNKVQAYICTSCYERVAENTKKRINTGNFKFFKGK